MEGVEKVGCFALGWLLKGSCAEEIVFQDRRMRSPVITRKWGRRKITHMSGKGR